MIGTLIVIDGIDGSGKATQARLLHERLAKEGIAAEKIDFPRYNSQVYGEFLGECIAGKHGDFQHLDPKIISTLFALDRFEALDQIHEWFAQGKIVIADRFTSSNQIHQGGKIVDVEKRTKFLAWVDRVEHEVFGLPRPGAVIYLRVPVDTSMELLSKEREVKNQALEEAGADLLEKDKMYLERSLESAEQLSKNPDWHAIECVVDGHMRSPESIHEDVYTIVSKMLA